MKIILLSKTSSIESRKLRADVDHDALNSASLIDPPTKLHVHTSIFTLFDLIWPWMTLPNFWRQQLTPTIKFHVHTPMCAQFDLWMTPDDLEMTFKIFGTNNWPHPPSFMSIYQCDPYFSSFDLRWPLMTSKWPTKLLASLIDPTH